jgi:indole-3-glycerol phosphate synthase
MSDQPTYLDEILAAKRAELSSGLLDNPSFAQIEAELAGAPDPLDLWAALATGQKPRAIAEFVRRTPNDGVLRDHADPRHVATLFVDAGAAAISVATDRRFDGSFEDLRAIRAAVSVPILCRDFILTRQQVIEARREGADAISLIVAALEPPHLRDLLNFAYDIGLQVLAEAHDDRELERAMAAGAKIVALDAQDLHTLEVDLDRIIRYRPDVPPSFLYVGVSGIAGRKDLSRLRAAGVDAVLLGSELMQAEDPGAKLAELMTV